MRNILLGVVAILLVIFAVDFFSNHNNEEENIAESSALIQKEIKNVGKLIVTEGTFAQVFTFSNNKKFYLDIFSARKKAIVVVNAKVTIAYDLRKIKTEIDEDLKTVRITKIPEPELNINPNIGYYDVTQDYLNKFEAKDYNKIKKHVDQSIRQKVENSPLRANAQNRLISELQRIYLLTSTLGWTLEYNQKPIQSPEELQQLKF